MQIEGLENRLLFAAVKFVSPLLGANEIPARDTLARGVVRFTLSRDGTELRYRLVANRIRNVVGAHIHVGAATENGPIAVDLMDPVGTRMRPRKVAIRGSIVASELTGPLAGMTLTELVNRMTAGGTYVNVHTNDGADPPDTGPGDFPGGEIRGQVRRLGRVFNNNPTIPNPPNGGPGY